jgi:phage FluMu protein Com
MNPFLYKMLSKLRSPLKQKCPKCGLENEVKPDQETKCARCGVILAPVQSK